MTPCRLSLRRLTTEWQVPRPWTIAWQPTNSKQHGPFCMMFQKRTEAIFVQLQAVSQEDGRDLDPDNRLASRGGGAPRGAGAGINAGRANLSNEAPPIGSVHKASVMSIKPFGVFVAMEGFRSNGLVHLTQVRLPAHVNSLGDSALPDMLFLCGEAAVHAEGLMCLCQGLQGSSDCSFPGSCTPRGQHVTERLGHYFADRNH